MAPQADSSGFVAAASTMEGRILHVDPSGQLYAGRASDVLVSSDDGATWSELIRLPNSRLRSLAEPWRLVRRLLRYEARALAKLSGSRYVISNREGVFFWSCD